MDQLLVDHAISRGVTFTPETHASVVKHGTRGWAVQLTSGIESRRVTPRMVLIADGLGGSALRDLPQMQPVIATKSWIGIGCVLDEAPFSQHVAPGQIAMHTAAGGYAGLVRLRDGKIALAAALAPTLIKRAGSPARAIQEILRSCGRSIEMPLDTDIKGTPLLTRTRPQLGLAKMLIIGDAAGYVEPFTGEGMTWALAGAQRAAALTAQVLQRTLSGEAAATAWRTWHAHHIGARQRTCRTVRALVHTPGLAQILIRSAGIFAPLKSIVASQVHGISEPYAARTSP
jgi:flavin-dependent dehydrogenase